MGNKIYYSIRRGENIILYQYWGGGVYDPQISRKNIVIRKSNSYTFLLPVRIGFPVCRADGPKGSRYFKDPDLVNFHKIGVKGIFDLSPSQFLIIILTPSGQSL